MDQKKIIQKFMEKGKLLTPSALEFLEDKDIDTFLSRNYPGILITETDLSFTLPVMKIVKNITTLPKEITTEDFVSFWRSKYTKMQGIILGRVRKEFTSLNKIDSTRKEVYVIGIVKTIEKKGEKFSVELEDLTATTPVIFDDIEDLEIDDVIAIKGISAGNVIYGKQILYPDLPLRSPAKGYDKACFISDIHLEESPASDFETFLKWFVKEDTDYLFVSGDIGDIKLFEELVEEHCYNKTIIVIPGEKESQDYPATPINFKNKNIVSLSNPAIIELNGLKILVIHKFDLTMLKKRHLGRTKIITKEDYLTLEEVPDIVHCGHTHEPRVSNYKSVTIINSGSLLTNFSPVIVDFSTRETIQINLNK